MDKLAYLKQMENYANENNVPIIEADGLKVLLEIIKKEQPQRILELGTAIGYSSAKMHLATGAEIYTIERDQQMYQLACENHRNLDLENEITRFFDDALLIENQNMGKFDVIYVDAAKAQNIKFVEKYQGNLAENGIFIFDNLLFHGYVNKDASEIPSRNLRQLIRKINNFLDYAKNHEFFSFELYENGDGIGIMRYKKENYAENNNDTL